MKKYVTNEELRDILADLADAFMENKRYDVTISLSHFSSCDDLKVQIQDCKSSYKTISYESYSIIDKPRDSFEVVGVIETAIEKHEAELVKVDTEAELPIEFPCV